MSPTKTKNLKNTSPSITSNRPKESPYLTSLPTPFNRFLTFKELFQKGLSNNKETTMMLLKPSHSSILIKGKSFLTKSPTNLSSTS